jgi:hypothetical protein
VSRKLKKKKKILSKKKLKNKTEEYNEANGEEIPFRNLGFPTLIKYLESIPNKINLRK